jgi:amino acid transporter
VNLLTVVKLVPLLLLVGVGFFFIEAGRVAVWPLPESGSLRQATLLLVFAYGGFENASVPTEESRDPRRHVPVALLFTIAATTVLYILIQVVAQGTLPDLAPSPAPLAAAARNVLGPSGALLMTAGAVVSTVGSISALALVGPRILYAFARHGQLPSALADVHPRYRTPHVAVVAFAVLAGAAALAGDFAELAAVSAGARLLFGASTCLAIPVLRRRLRPDQRDFRLPGGPAIPLAAAAFSIWLLAGLTPAQALAALVGLLSGLAVYAAVELSRVARGSGGP